MPAGGSRSGRLEAPLAVGILVAFFLPWIEGPVHLSGLELVSLARGRQAAQAEAILLVAFAGIPVLALLTLAATLLRHGVRLLGGICGVLALAGMSLLWLARQSAAPGAGQLGFGGYATGLLGLLLLLAACNVIRLPPSRPSMSERR